MRQEDYPPGTIVFAKLKGYPWWPARVEDEKRVPAKVLKQKKTTKSKGPIWTVFFFGSKDYGFFGPDAIRPFDSENVERDLTAKKFKTKELENAVRQALDPSLLQKEEQEDENEDEQSEEDEAAKKSRRTRSSRNSASIADPSPAKKKSTTTTSPSKKSKSNSNTPKEEDEDEEVEDESSVKSKRRSRKLDEIAVKEVIGSAENGRKKRRKSVSLEKEERQASPAASSRHSDESTSEKPKEGPEGYEEERRRVYTLRHKMQKFVYQKKPGEILKEEYGIISALLKKVEDTYMTRRLLRDTKIGTVVKAAGQYVFEDDVEYNIQARARRLMSSWRERFENRKATHDFGKAVIPPSTALPTTGIVATKNNSENTETKHQDTMQVDSPAPAAEENKVDEDHTESGSVAMVIDETPAMTTITSANVVDTVMRDAP